MDAKRMQEIERDILERSKIIEGYRHSGMLDREDAINKIRSMRFKDSNVSVISSVNMINNAIPFTIATNEQLVNELQMQVDILRGELMEAT